MRRVLPIVIVAGVLVLATVTAFAQGQPMATYTLFGPQRLTGGVAFTEAPRVIGGWLDVASIADYSSSDVFVIVDGEPGFVLTSTVQVSTDGQNWTPVGYESIDPETRQFEIEPSMRVQSESGAVYFEKQNAGTYLRVMLEGEGVYTPTVKVIYSDKMRRQSIER